MVTQTLFTQENKYIELLVYYVSPHMLDQIILKLNVTYPITDL